MAFDDLLAERIRKELDDRSVTYIEKRMMGGLCFMVDNKMCIGITGDALMARVGPNFYQEALSLEGARKMDFTGRPMKGFIFVDPEGIDTDQDLNSWIQKCLDFNPLAKSSKRKKSR